MKNELSFEQAIERLGTLTDILENAQTTLDDSLAAFEEGMKLIAFCRKKLSQAEKKMILLTKEGNPETAEES